MNLKLGNVSEIQPFTFYMSKVEVTGKQMSTAILFIFIINVEINPIVLILYAEGTQVH